jgi:hypothetical protein
MVLLNLAFESAILVISKMTVLNLFLRIEMMGTYASFPHTPDLVLVICGDSCGVQDLHLHPERIFEAAHPATWRFANSVEEKPLFE